MNALLIPPIDPDLLYLLPDGDRYEIVDGHLVEKEAMGAQASEAATNLCIALGNHCRPRKLGRVYIEAGYRCFSHEKTRLRLPDVSFVAESRLPEGRSPRNYFSIPPDMAAEVVSPTDVGENIEAKVADYRSAGVKLIWVLYPETRTVLIRRLDGTTSEVGPDGTLSGEDVIPGFTCRIAELFE